MSADEIRALTGKELDRAVALALGFKNIYWSYRNVPVMRDGEWTSEEKEILVYCTPGPKAAAVGAGEVEIGHYSTDPAAADLVRQEIERRGWTWFSWHCLPNDTFRKQVEWTWSIDFGGESDAEVFSVVGPHEALCRAFLFAHHAVSVPDAS